MYYKINKCMTKSVDQGAIIYDKEFGNTANIDMDS
jgi:hypothetical protein